MDLRSGYVTLRQRKGRGETRKRVALSEPARKALPEAGGEGYVFMAPNGRDYDDRWRRLEFATRFKVACIAAGHAWGSVKTLRTTFATWAEESDVPVEMTQRALGHADVRTTQRFYTRSQADRTRGAVDAVASLIDTQVDSKLIMERETGLEPATLSLGS